MGVAADAEGWECKDVFETYRGRGRDVEVGSQGFIGVFWVSPRCELCLHRASYTSLSTASASRRQQRVSPADVPEEQLVHPPHPHSPKPTRTIPSPALSLSSLPITFQATLPPLHRSL